MKYCIIIFIIFSGCGTDPEYGSNDPKPYECINCDLVPPEQKEDIPFEPSSCLYFTPPKLSFFYDRVYFYDIGDPKYIDLCNATDEVILITNVYIKGVLYVGGSDDSFYFILSPMNIPRYLNINDCFTIGVSFVYSEQQRSAELVVNNTFSDISALLVGKVFAF